MVLFELEEVKIKKFQIFVCDIRGGSRNQVIRQMLGVVSPQHLNIYA